ncbi:hypothetical protein BGZ83_011886, partial [Gryganskiella cystojenkinii]
RGQPRIQLETLDKQPNDESLVNVALTRQLVKFGLMKKEYANLPYAVPVSLIRVAKTKYHFDSIVFINPSRIMRSLLWLVMRRPIAMEADIARELFNSRCGVLLPKDVFRGVDKPVCVSYHDNALYIRELPEDILTLCKSAKLNVVLSSLGSEYFISHSLTEKVVTKMAYYNEMANTGNKLWKVYHERVDFESTDPETRETVQYVPGKCILDKETLAAIFNEGTVAGNNTLIKQRGPRRTTSALSIKHWSWGGG